MTLFTVLIRLAAVAGLAILTRVPLLASSVEAPAGNGSGQWSQLLILDVCLARAFRRRDSARSLFGNGVTVKGTFYFYSPR